MGGGRRSRLGWPAGVGVLRGVEPSPRTSLEPEQCAEWVRLAGAGDRGAFEHLYDAFASTVHGVLLSWVSPQDAADLVQDVFVSVLRALGRLEDPKHFPSWICTIARNRARDHLKRRRPSEELPEELPEDARGVRAREADRDGANEVLARLRELPEAYRETLSLRLVEGLSGPEIAERTGLTHGSVRVNLHRGMKLLRTALGDGDDR